MAEFQPFYSSRPGGETSSRQSVFEISVGKGNEWPDECHIEYNLDGVDGIQEVPADQDHEKVYLVFHDVAPGVHTLTATVKSAGYPDEDLGKIRWEIVEAHTQVPQNVQVDLAGEAHISGGSGGDATVG